jgi:membrane-associated phospholipid phosphatase
VTSLDSAVISFLNQFAQRSWTFDSVVFFVAENHLFKGYVVLPLVWWVWYRGGVRREENRQLILTTLVACIIGVAISQASQFVWIRPRPLWEPALNFTIPHAVPSPYLRAESSFPSDHAAFFLSLATGLLFVSETLGWAVLTYAILVVLLPRVYLGFHYPTDILGGGILGGGLTYVFCKSRSIRECLGGAGLAWERRKPATFYATLFIVTALMAQLFDSLSDLVRFAVATLKTVLPKLGG